MRCRGPILLLFASLTFLVDPLIDRSIAQFMTFIPRYHNQSEAIKAVELRSEELKNQAMPKSEAAMVRELDRIENEIQMVNSQIGMMGALADFEKRLDEAISLIRNSHRRLMSLNCQSEINAFRTTLFEYNNSTFSLRSLLSNYNDVSTSSIQIFIPNIDANACGQIKADLSDEILDTEIGKITKQAISKVNESRQEADKIRIANSALSEVLKNRRSKINEALNSGSPQQKITANLPLILAILGGACVLAIVGIKLFDTEIQMEWVVSGQVIQFVTVMVLLSVITALALSEVLKETTLGTLLGGIAGYVLAQGVGRAAARDVARNSLKKSRGSLKNGAKTAADAKD